MLNSVGGIHMIDIAVTFVQSVCAVLMIKILIDKFYLNVKDCLLILLLGIGGGLLFPHIGVFISPMMSGILCYYVYQLYQYNFRKSIFLSTLTMLILILFDHIASIILSIIFAETAFTNDYLLVIHLSIALSLTIIFTLFFTKITKKIRLIINQNESL